MATPEKRSHKRVRRPFTARIRPYQAAEDPQKPVKWDIVTMRDLSASGVSFNYTKVFPEDTVLELNIPLPLVAEPIHCRAVVLRWEDAPSGGGAARIPVYKIAVSFIEITPQQKDTLAAYLAKQ